MKRKIFLVVSSLLVIVILAAGCSSIQLPWARANSSRQSQTGQAPQTVEDKLAVGTLKLEGTQNAVTAEQAKKLLPLWKAVKGLSNDTKTTTQEMDGLYKQILAAMTPEQVKVIQDMTIAQGDIQEIMQKYGFQMRGAAPGQSPRVARTPSAGSGSGGSNGSGQRRFQGGPGGGFQGGPLPGGGLPEGGFQRNGQGSGGQNTQTTPQVGASQQGFRGGLNFMLSDAIIKLLQQKAGS